MAQYGPPELAVMARGTQAAGPAMTALRAVGASTASIIRCLGIAYTLGQLAIWHSFFAANPWRLAGPVIAMAWGATVVVYLSRRRPGWAPAAVDSAVYIGLALGAGWCVPPAMRGDGSNWLYIVMLGQLVAPAWFSPIVVSAPLALASVASYYVGAVMAPHVSSGTGRRWRPPSCCSPSRPRPGPDAGSWSAGPPGRTSPWSRSTSSPARTTST